MIVHLFRIYWLIIWGFEGIYRGNENIKEAKKHFPNKLSGGE
jgi:hypothetical protein